MTAASTEADEGRPSWFQRFLLPGFAFKAVIIGGGYATGRELAEFFLPHGPWGGLAGMLLATVIWSLIAALTFALAYVVRAYDYRSFFRSLLGPAWIGFELCYILFVILILSVFGAAAGEIGAAMFGLPLLAGTLALCSAITAFVAFGNRSVETLFKYVSLLLYAVYGLFLILALSAFHGDITRHFASPVAMGDWPVSGIAYASYNVIGAVVVLPVVRHMTSRRDAIVAGVVAGPLAMLPAILFFIAMIAFFPGIVHETLPSDFILRQLGNPVFHLLFQLMIFAALLESGTGSVHAINERISNVLQARGRGALSPAHRACIAVFLLLVCVFLAQRFGLIALIANGYRLLAVMFLVTYVLPLLTLGVLRLVRSPSAQEKESL